MSWFDFRCVYNCVATAPPGCYSYGIATQRFEWPKIASYSFMPFSEIESSTSFRKREGKTLLKLLLGKYNDLFVFLSAITPECLDSLWGIALSSVGLVIRLSCCSYSDAWHPSQPLLPQFVHQCCWTWSKFLLNRDFCGEPVTEPQCFRASFCLSVCFVLFSRMLWVDTDRITDVKTISRNCR